jgi:hypothetical protein
MKSKRRKIFGAVLIALGLLPLVALAKGLASAGVVVFLLGAGVLLLGGPIIPITLVMFPIVWAKRLSRKWRIVSSVPALTLAGVAIGYALPSLGILPRAAFANLGPPFIAGVWVVVILIYVGVLAWTMPMPAAANE